jgi:PhnB protein
MAAVNPYLTFSNNCAEAFDFYKSAFGTEFLTRMLFSDIPNSKRDAKEGNKVMHVALPIGQGTILMGSDSPAEYGPLREGDNLSVAISAASEEEAKKLFDSLSAGGKVTMPLEKAFWGALFGMFTDKYGVQWMVNYDYEKKN